MADPEVVVAAPVNLDTREDRQRAAEDTAHSLSRLALTDARRQLSVILREAWTLSGAERRDRLDYNARLCTVLRVRKVRIWGDDE